MTHTVARGQVYLIDLDERKIASRWSYQGPDGSFADAAGVAIDAAFHIFVADPRNDIVRVFNPFGKQVGTLGRVPERGPGAASRDRRGILDRPHALACYGDTLYVACGDRKLVRGVQRFAIADGGPREHLRAFGDTEARFGAPKGVAVDDQGIWVADSLHGCIQRFRVHGRFVHHFPTGTAPGEASRPVAVLPLAEGKGLLVLDQGDRPGLRLFSPGGEPLPFTLPDAVQLDQPSHLARDERGRVYILDRDGERVQRLHPDLSYDEAVVDLAEVVLEDT